MDLQTREVENGTEITVYSEQKVAISVRSGQEETIYLPGSSSSDSTYYAESSEGLARTERGFKVVHHGNIDRIDVIGE